MPKTKVTVNGTEYDSVIEGLGGQITLSSSKHTTNMVTTLDELKTHYGVKQAYSVKVALGSRV